jgi:beta-mannanase
LTGPSPSWVSDHDGILFVQIDLTLASISAIAAGNYDVCLRSYAASVRSYGKPVVIGFGHEVNGSWYPWSHASPGRLRGRMAAHCDVVPQAGEPGT